jgi:hypothetical protein
LFKLKLHYHWSHPSSGSSEKSLCKKKRFFHPCIISRCHICNETSVKQLETHAENTQGQVEFSREINIETDSTLCRVADSEPILKSIVNNEENTFVENETESELTVTQEPITRVEVTEICSADTKTRFD